MQNQPFEIRRSKDMRIVLEICILDPKESFYAEKNGY